MMTSRRLPALLLLFGIILLCWFLTPFIDIHSGELVHTHITFVGKLLVGRFLIYIAILATVCLGIAMVQRRKYSKP